MSGSGYADHSETYGMKARHLYGQGLNCAEAVIGAFENDERFESPHHLIGAMLGGGVGDRGATCGALLGGLILIGAYVDSLGYERAEAKELPKTLGNDLIEQFRLEHRSCACDDIIDVNKEQNRAESGCADIVESAANQVDMLVQYHQMLTAVGDCNEFG